MFERFNHIVQDKLVALRVGRGRRIQLLNGRPPLAQCLKSGLASHERMSEGALCCLALIVYRKAVGRFKAAFFARLGYSQQTGRSFKKTYRRLLELVPPWSVKRVPLAASMRSMVSCEDRRGGSPGDNSLDRKNW